jgi:hypothetical protein
MASTDSENVMRLSTLAHSLAQSLEKELLRIEGGQTRPCVKEMYEAIIPAQADRAQPTSPAAFCRLRLAPALPALHQDLAATQLRIVVELLRLIVLALNFPRP